MAARSRSGLWQCPRCGRRFASKNLWHSCGQYDLESRFSKRSPELRRIFDRLCDMLQALGPVTVYAQKTRIVFQARVRFASVIVRKEWLDLGLWLRRRANHPRLHKVEHLGGGSLYHYLRLTDESQVDEEIKRLLAEAYEQNAGR